MVTESVPFVSWISLLALLLGIIIVFSTLHWKPKNWELLHQIPGPPKLPILGNSLDLNVGNHEFLYVMENWVKKYGKRIFISIGSFPRIILVDRNDVEKIFNSNVHINKGEDYTFLQPWLGNGLVTTGGDQWFSRRKLLTPAFHFRILDTFLHVFNEHSTKLVQDLEKKYSGGEAFDVFPHVTRCALEVISETAMGTKLNTQAGSEESAYVRGIYRISELILHRMVRPWLRPNFLWRLSPSGREEKLVLNTLHNFTEKVIRKRKAELAQQKLDGNAQTSQKENDVYGKGKRRLAFLDLLLEAQAEGIEKEETSVLSDLNIREEVDTFMFAGHDTTTANICWTIFNIASHPEVQAKLHAELDGIFESDKVRSITSEDLTRMKYLESCIKESLRLHPSVPWIGRKLSIDLSLDHEITLPSGTTLYMFPYFLHRDPEVFPDPEIFDPERFSLEASIGRHPYAYTPFAAGPRNCIGQKFAMMEVKVVLAQLFRRFFLTAIEKKDDLVLCVDVILRSQNGINVKLSPRI